MNILIGMGFSVTIEDHDHAMRDRLLATKEFFDALPDSVDADPSHLRDLADCFDQIIAVVRRARACQARGGES